MPVAYAHSLYAPTPPGFFQLKWAWDPTLIFFLILGVFYWRGLRAFKGRRPVKRWQIALFFTGLVTLALAYLPPVDPLSDQLFFVHMVQHMMITLIGVPLLIFGAPFFVAVRGLDPWTRRNVYLPLLRNRPFQWALGVVQSPLFAFGLFEAVFWFWHVPRYYNMALLNDAIHLVEHGCMAFAAMNLWRLVIDPHPMRSPVPLPFRLLFVGLLMAFDIALSAALTYAETIWYAYEGLPMPDWWLWSRIEDQRLGGLIMWVAGGTIWLLAMTVIFFVWAHKEQEKDRRMQADLKDALPA
jgi:cytochrome c oxidase assembly factor CtaG